MSKEYHQFQANLMANQTYIGEAKSINSWYIWGYLSIADGGLHNPTELADKFGLDETDNPKNWRAWEMGKADGQAAWDQDE